MGSFTIWWTTLEGEHRETEMVDTYYSVLDYAEHLERVHGATNVQVYDSEWELCRG